MEELSPIAHEESNAYDEEIITDEEEIKTLSVDKFTIEKIVLESPNSREVVFTKSGSSETVCASTRRITRRTRPEKWLRNQEGQDCFDAKIQKRRTSGSEKLNGVKSFGKGLTKVPAGRVQKAGSASVLNERKFIPIKFKSSSISSLVTFDEFGKHVEPSHSCKISPIIPPKPIRKTKYDPNVNLEFLAIAGTLRDDTKENVDKRKVECEKKDDELLDLNELTSTTAQAHLQTSHFEIGRLQKNLVKIDSVTAEVYKQQLPILHLNQLKVCPISDEYLDKNVNNIFDEDFLSKHNYNYKLKIEEKRFLETDFNYVPEIDLVSDETLEKPRWSREVSEVEKRWSGEFLDTYNDRNSSESSKSSYIEELGSVSSHDGVIEEIRRKSHMKSSFQQTDRVREYHKDIEEVFAETVSTIDSTSCVEERIESVDEDIRGKVRNNSYESHDSTLKDSLSITTSLDEKSLQEDNRIYAEPTESEENIINNNPELFSKDQPTLIPERVTEKETGELQTSDGYAELIREMTMEPGPSKCKEEKKKKSGLRRLLPGLFSPKDSRKDYKKEQKERKKRDERHFSQHQQNGIYTRSPDTMNLNEDIKRNVNLDTSLNGSIIEERLNEIKQELFPDQGMTTSTPDHFLQDRSFHDRRTPRMYTANSSLSSIAVDDKWIDQNIISGSPDMKKFKQQNRNDGEKCSLEHKHSFQESRPRFSRNHAPSGRISAPPSERYLIRPRAIHPIDRPLPAIPQKGEFCNYQNHEEIRKHPAYSRESKMNYQGGVYYSTDRNRSNETELYENSNFLEKIEINRNHSIDSGFNLTTGLTPVEMNQQCIISPSGQKIPVHVTKSPKYSPSWSQKSGDYADSNYTPNSSQKSEFSPGSSKSGEYYLNSPRNSCQMSPDTSFNPDQVDSDKTITSYQVPSNIGIQIKDDNLYDEAPRSLSVSPRQSHVNTNQETTYIRGSPNIPLSTNLAKLRANVETTRSESPTNSDDKVQAPRLSSPCMINLSPESPGPSDKSSQVTPPSRVTMIPRVTSPLTVFMPESNTLMASESRSHSSTPLNFGVIPSPRILIETKSPDRVRTPVSSPIISQVRTTGCVQMSTFHPRKAQPNDQILIASPKREAIYEQRSPSRMEPKSPDSPVPMADSPSQVFPANRNHRHIENRFGRSKSANLHELFHQPPPQAFQDKPQRSLSPQFRQTSPRQVIQRPEPIYIKRQAPQRVVSPLGITSEEGKDSYGPNGRSNMLLVQASPERIPLQSSKSPVQHVVYQQKLQSSSKDLPEIINMQQRITLRSISSPVQTDLNIFPEKSEALPLRKKSLSPSHERPQGIYEDQRVSVEPIYGRKITSSPVPMPVRSSLASPRSNPSIYISKQETLTQEQIYGRQEIAREHIDVQRSHKQDSIYGQRMSEPIYGQNPNKQISPSKRQTLQHLEAFYWQQKALEDQRTTTNSPTVSNRSPQDSKVEPEVREAIYWQQLKKLNEEQQREIFERHQFEEMNEMVKKKLQIQPAAKGVNQEQEHSKQMYWQINAQLKNTVATKPPIVGQKVQNQPVLVVRPQQAVRDQNVLKNQRSKSVSPHFVRNDERRSLQLPKRSTVIGDSGLGGGKFDSVIVHKSTTPPIYEENEDRKNPPPIFKRGSLISNSSSSVDYGTMGTKRVSFSNQSNSPEIGSGNWPTKHGSAPEPPTRKHRTEEKISDTTDLSFTRIQEENQNNANNIYGNIVHESDYDAKPLPPPPMRDGIMIRRCNSMRDNRNQRIEVQRGKFLAHPRRWIVSESESGSEAGEVQRILQRRNEEEWNPGGKGHQSNDTGGSGRAEGEGGSNELPGGRRSGGIGVLGNVGVGRASTTSGSGGGRSRDEPRRHTLSGDHAPSLHHQQFNAQQLHPLHPHHLPPPHGQYSTPPRHGTMDLESPLPRGYPPPSTAMLFDEDPGIMSEVETSSTGFRRGGKQRSSLPVVRTPSKTLERPLGLVFLQYRKETKRALLPNEITSIDTVKALFVRSFPKQLTMEYLDSPDVKVYIHDSNKDMFYELEDHRSHLRDIRDRSVLRLIEKNDIVGMPGPLQGVPVGGQGLPPHWEDQSYFSEPEFDSEFQHQHIHKSKKSQQHQTRKHPRHLSAILDTVITTCAQQLVLLMRKNSSQNGAQMAWMFPCLMLLRFLKLSSQSINNVKHEFYGFVILTLTFFIRKNESITVESGIPVTFRLTTWRLMMQIPMGFQLMIFLAIKAAKNSTSGNYYMGGSSTLPRGGSIMRAYSPAASAVLAGPNATPTQPKVLGTPGGGGVAPAKPLRGYQCGKTPLGSLGGSARFSRDSSVSLYSIPDRIHGESGYMSSPERGVATGIGRYPGPYSTQSSYEEPYYSQYSGTVTPVIDEEASDTELLEESYSLYGVKPPGRPPSGPPRSPFPSGAPALPPGQTYDVTRIRVEHMERQLANLTGLVQKALTHAPHTSPSPRDYLQVPAGRDPYTRSAGAGDEFDKHSSSSSASLPDKSVSFEKSVSFSDEPPDMNSPKQHSPQHAADTKPTKPAIKSSTLPRMSSQERDRHKPNLPPKPVALAAGGYVYRDLALTPEMYNQLRGLQKKAKDLRQEVRNLRRMSQAQAHTVRETIRDTFITIRAMLLSGGDAAWAAGDSEKVRLSREEDLYKQEMIRLEKDLTELESTVEELRGNVINRKTRVNMSDVENMALILSKSSKTVADLKVRFPSLQEGMKGLLSSEMEKVVREEKFLKEEPERLESALRRCKKLTGTLVTLKRLASVQEQRLPNAVSLDSEETPPITPTSAQHSKTTAPVPAERTHLGSASLIGGGSNPSDSSAANQQRPENALDALLDELQTFSRPSSQLSQVSLTNNQTNHIPTMLEIGRSSSQIIQSSIRPPNISEIGRKGSIDSSSSATNLQLIQSGTTTLRRLHSYPSSSDTDTSPPIARIQVNDNGIQLQQQKPPVPERNAELLQLATSRRVPPPPPPRTSSRSPLASPTSPQLPPRNPTGTLRRGRGVKEINKPPMALPGSINSDADQQAGLNNILSTSNSSSCESINSQEGMQNKKGRQEQLEQRHQELLRKQKALQEQYARLQQLQRNTSGLTTVPPTPPDLLKKTGSESNLLAKMGLSMSAANSGSLTSLTTKNNETVNELQNNSGNNNLTTTSKIYETDIL